MAAANILRKIISNKKKEVAAAKETVTMDMLLNEMMKAPANRNFRDVLDYGNFTIIGEIKKKAPSKGVMKKTIDLKKLTKAYENAGIKALSILTDKKFFDGKLEYIREAKKYVNTPILRKDFIIDEYQIYESRVARADAILLLASVLEKRYLNSFVKKARFLNMTPIVEVTTPDEVKKAVSSGADIIGINTRDLKTFKINHNKVRNLIKYIPKDKIVIIESGIKKPSDLEELVIDPRIKGVLIGSMFMEARGEKQIKELAGDILYQYDNEA